MPTPHPRFWHAGSVFGTGPRRPLDREARARFRYLVGIHHRAGRLSRAARDVAEAMVRRLGQDGRLDPSHDCLAGDAACSSRTVRRVLEVLRSLGLLTWQRRLVRDGWRVAQTSSAYVLNTVVMAPLPPLARPKPCDGHYVRQTRLDMIQPVYPPPTLMEVVAARAALAARRATIEKKWLMKKRA